MSRISERPKCSVIDPTSGYSVRFNRHPKRKNNFKVAEMYDCYKDGMSLATIAKLYKCTRQSVYDNFQTRGYRLRSKKLKGARTVDDVQYTFDGEGYLRGTKDGKRIYLHKSVWVKANGPVPIGFQLHFKDEDKENCAVENLELSPLEKMSLVFNPDHHNQYTKRHEQAVL